MTVTCCLRQSCKRSSDEQGIAERYDWVIDFSGTTSEDKVWMVNTAEHRDGKKPSADLTIAQALSGSPLILASESSWNSASCGTQPLLT